jgi:protein phosphatase
MVGMLSDIGEVRKVNEDFLGFYENPEMKLYVVSDGMGGHNAGEVASKLAVDTIIQHIKDSEQVEDKEEMLVDAIINANMKIYEVSKTNHSLNGMGTTVTACLVDESNMIVANVGDSRCYIISEGQIKQITKDHSLVQELVDSGSITQAEAEVHPNKNIITRSLGTSPNVNVDTFSVDLATVYKVILCTDGLSNSVSSEEILTILKSRDNESACKELVELSKQRGGRDNITVIVFEGECKDDRDFTRE